MIILGIDPGSTRIGYGAISLGRPAGLAKNKKLSLIGYGTIEINPTHKTMYGAQRKGADKLILEAAENLRKIIKKYKPSIIGVEKLYFMKNIKTGIEVAQTRGALILEIARHGIPVEEFSPSEIKLSVAGYGLADKKAVSKMAAVFLGLKNQKLKGYDDASDALATAITTANRKHWPR